jgi:hypothetical protein
LPVGYRPQGCAGHADSLRCRNSSAEAGVTRHLTKGSASPR